jgi:CheY-like chemotaxis protein
MSSSSPGPQAGHPSRHVLLVDDDDAVRDVLRKVLLAAGYRVTEAATGTEAVAAFEQQCPDILLTDLVLPPPNGQELASLCRSHCPGTILVFMSGYSEEELHDLDIRQVVFLPKPIEADKLVQSLEQLLS